MEGELVPGKLTLVERGGIEFELPDSHTIELYAGHKGEATYVSLNARGVGGSLYTMRELEERRGAVVVHLGEWMGSSGAGEWGGVVPTPMGYPFPN